MASVAASSRPWGYPLCWRLVVTKSMVSKDKAKAGFMRLLVRLHNRGASRTKGAHEGRSATGAPPEREQATDSGALNDRHADAMPEFVSEFSQSETECQTRTCMSAYIIHNFISFMHMCVAFSYDATTVRT